MDPTDRSLRRGALAVLLLIVLAMVPADLAAQGGVDPSVRGEASLPERSGRALMPYAGKYEPRIGGSRESERDKLRLDIGAGVDLFEIRYTKPITETTMGMPIQESPFRREVGRLSFGTEFFTWTRLRAADNFKFPVEAVDYYFGIRGQMHFDEQIVSDVRLRVAHISAHLVDGDPSFTSPVQQYMTYSREFADLMVGFMPLVRWISLGSNDRTGARIRPYVGAQWLFHTIPDTLGMLTPYAGLDVAVQPFRVPVALRFGYEARLNTELEPIGEHEVRLGVKFGMIDSHGLLIEGSYYSGRSHYGQHFSERERYFSLGFAVDF